MRRTDQERADGKPDLLAARAAASTTGEHRSGDAETAQLMRLTELVPTVPLEVHRAARMATAQVWRQVVTARRRRRRLALAWVALVTIGVVGWLFERVPSVGGMDWAHVEAVQGTVAAGDGALRIGGVVAPTTRIETAAGGRVALRLAAGQSLRVDENSRLELLADGVIALEQGGLYIDSGQRATGDSDPRPLEIRTPFGVARNMGTQFEVRLDGDGLRVRVREGAVRVAHQGGQDEARMGDELILSEGAVQRRSVAPFGAAWSWPLEVAPVFPLEGSSLGDYLEWIARETGWLVRFENPSLATHAVSIVLHGSLEGFAVAESLNLVLASCELTHQVDGGTLILGHTQ